MQTRREQVRAYRFVTRRVVSAMLSGEPDTNDLPMRRLSLATFGSAMMATIVFAGVGAFGLLSAGGGQLKQHSIIIERDTGARYVYLDDNLLHPVLNYASARLILGDANPDVHTMSSASLKGVPRGRVLGIAGAPDSLPGPKQLVGLPWTLCSAPRSADLPDLVSQLIVGDAPAGGTGLGSSALSIASGDGYGDRYLVWRTPAGAVERLYIRSTDVLLALSMTGDPVRISQAVLNGIPTGPDLKTIDVEGFGRPTDQQIHGETAHLGQVYRVDNQFYVMLGNGLALIGDVSRRLLPDNGAQTPTVVGAQEMAALHPNLHFEPEGYPTELPGIFRAGVKSPAVCATYRPDATAGDEGSLDSTVAVYDQTPAALTAPTDTATQVNAGVRTVDRVVVGGGLGALVQVLPNPGATSTGATVYLITDAGRRFALANSPETRTALGYGGVTPLPIPAALLAIIPAGPVLDASNALANGTPAPTP